MAVLEQSVLSVADYLRNKNLRIPPFQRPYKWSVTNVLQLLDDIDRFRNKTSYRIGTIVICRENNEDQIVDGQQRTITFYLDLSQKDWYAFDDCFGTSEEKLFIKYIDKIYTKLKAGYDEVFLIRNERHFKVYNFEDGRALEPDFVLFLINHTREAFDHYQVFIEPKGGYLLQQDAWKERFLLSLRNENLIEQLWNDKKYIIWGMPFYNEVLGKDKFEKEFDQLMPKAID